MAAQFHIVKAGYWPEANTTLCGLPWPSASAVFSSNDTLVFKARAADQLCADCWTDWQPQNADAAAKAAAMDADRAVDETRRCELTGCRETATAVCAPAGVGDGVIAGEALLLLCAAHSDEARYIRCRRREYGGYEAASALAPGLVHITDVESWAIRCGKAREDFYFEQSVHSDNADAIERHRAAGELCAECDSALDGGYTPEFTEALIRTRDAENAERNKVICAECGNRFAGDAYGRGCICPKPQMTIRRCRACGRTGRTLTPAGMCAYARLKCNRLAQERKAREALADTAAFPGE